MRLFDLLVLCRAPGAALAAVGVFWGGVASVMPDLKAQAGAGDGELGAALLMSAAGGMLSMYLAPRAGQLLGRLLLPVSAAALVLAFGFALPAQSVPALGVALFGMGLAVAMLDIAANVRVSALEARHGVHLMNLNHAMFSFAFGGAALVTGLARKAGAGPPEILPWLALFCVGLGLLTWQRRAEAGAAAAIVPEPPGGAPMPWLVIGLTAVILFSAFIGENATEAWSALHIERTLGGLPGEGGFGPAMLGLTMGLGRLGGQLATDRLGEERIVLASAVLGVLGAMVIAAAPTQAVVLAGVAVLGAGMAVVVPSANSILGKRVRDSQRSFALSRAWMVGFLGFFVGPSMMGMVAEVNSLRGSFVAAGLVIALIIPAVLAIARQPSVQ